MLLLHTSIHAFSHKCCFTPTHTHTHTPVHTQAFTHMSYTYAFTCMLFHTCCCTHAAYICLHRHPYTNTVRHALLHEHSCTRALLHKPLHPHMLCLFSAKRRAREEKSQPCRSLRKGDNHNWPPTIMWFERFAYCDSSAPTPALRKRKYERQGEAEKKRREKKEIERRER